MSDLIEREDVLDIVRMALRGDIPFALLYDIIMKIPSVKEKGNDSSVKYARQRQSASSNRPSKGN